MATNQKEFPYSLDGDALYQSYKDQYIQQGKLAMKDTMGQAAALTGGYGSTYGQQVGQQTYDAYLQNLSAVVPELYDRAYGRYQDAGDQLLQQYNLVGQQRDTEYGQYRDQLADWENERAFQTQLENTEYNRRTAAEEQEYTRRMAEDERNYQRSQDALAQQKDLYSSLYAIISASGYIPTDEELAAAGMTRAAAEALRAEYQRGVDMENAQFALQQASRSGGGGGGGGGSGGGGGGYGGDDYYDEYDEYLNSYVTPISAMSGSGNYTDSNKGKAKTTSSAWDPAQQLTNYVTNAIRSTTSSTTSSAKKKKTGNGGR